MGSNRWTSIEIERLREHPEPRRSPDDFSQLGRPLRQRYTLTKSPADLDAAVEAFQLAIESLPVDGTDRPAHLSNLAAALYDRFAQTSDPGDLDAAVAVAMEAVGPAEANTPQRPEYLSNLGAALLARHEATGDALDLESAITVLDRALSLAGDADDQFASAYYFNLSSAMQQRYLVSGTRESLDSAIRYARRAVDATDGNDPTLGPRLMGLGTSLMLKSLADGNADNVHDVLRILEQALHLQADEAERLRLAEVAAAFAASRSEWSSALKFCTRALTETDRPLVEKISPSLAARRAAVAADATSLAIRLQDIGESLRCFDSGRARLVAGESQFRRELPTLSRAAPHLAASLQQLHDYLRSASSDSGDTPDARTDRSRIRKQWNDEIARTRTLPGFARFLADQADGRPFVGREELLVVVNASRFGSYALVLRHDGADAVELPGLDVEILASRADEYTVAVLGGHDRWRDRESVLVKTLEWLWEAVVSRVVTQIQRSVRGSSRVNVKWCPSGPLALMPLHAAGAHGSSLMDIASSSYVARVQAGAGEPSAETATRSTAVVIAPKFGSPLAHLRSEIESLRQGFLTADVGYAQRDHATAAISSHAIVHFAGHGRWDGEDARSSGIMLDDGPLTTEDLIRLRLADTRLVVLSASCTALPSLRDPGEFLSPASALLAAGCPNVVGTLFSVRDSDASEFAAYFYRALARDDSPISHATVSRATAVAVEHLRRKYPETPSAWAGFVHLAGA